MKKYHKISLSYLESFFLEWKQVFDHAEVGRVFFSPYADDAYRAVQFTAWMKSEFSKDVRILDMAALLIEDEQGLYEKLTEYGKTPVIILTRSVFSSDEEENRIFPLIERYIISSGKGVLVLSQGYGDLLPENDKSISGLQHSFDFPLYPKEVVLHFSLEVMCEWGVDLSESELSGLIDYCGGYLWLVKDGLRSKRKNVKCKLEDIFSSTSFQSKVKMIWDSYPKIIQNILQRMQKNERLEKSLQTYGLDVGSLPKFLEDHIQTMRASLFSFEDGRIYHLDKDISSDFSVAERRVLKILYEKKGELLTRDVLGEAFWQVDYEEKYSDWALDKVISRLRKKIKNIDLPMRITTKRGMGYVCR